MSQPTGQVTRRQRVVKNIFIKIIFISLNPIFFLLFCVVKSNTSYGRAIWPCPGSLRVKNWATYFGIIILGGKFSLKFSQKPWLLLTWTPAYMFQFQGLGLRQNPYRHLFWAMLFYGHAFFVGFFCTTSPFPPLFYPFLDKKTKLFLESKLFFYWGGEVRWNLHKIISYYDQHWVF